MEHMQQGHLDYLRVSVMIVGQTKFEFDHLFALTAKAYASADVFTTEELAAKQTSCRHYH